MKRNGVRAAESGAAALAGGVHRRRRRRRKNRIDRYGWDYRQGKVRGRRRTDGMIMHGTRIQNGHWSMMRSDGRRSGKAWSSRLRRLGMRDGLSRGNACHV